MMNKSIDKRVEGLLLAILLLMAFGLGTCSQTFQQEGKKGGGLRDEPVYCRIDGSAMDSLVAINKGVQWYDSAKTRIASQIYMLILDNDSARLHGPARMYYEAGEIMQEVDYVNGEAVRGGRWYYKSGKLESIINIAVPLQWQRA